MFQKEIPRYICPLNNELDNMIASMAAKAGLDPDIFASDRIEFEEQKIVIGKIEKEVEE